MISCVAVVAVACVERVERPSASVEISPTAVCAGDDFTTVVAIDGSSSSPRLSLVPTSSDEPLEMSWRLSGDEFAIESGGLDEERIDVTMAGERPLSVELTVRNEAGGEFVTRRMVAITLDCPEDSQ